MNTQSAKRTLLTLPLLTLWAVASGPLQAAPPPTAPHKEKPAAVSAELPNPQAYKAGTPERALAEFLAAWHAKDFPRMAQFTHLTWKHVGNTDPIKGLKKEFGPIPILSAKIGGIAHGEDLPVPSQNVKNISVTIHYSSDTGPQTRTVAVPVFRDSRPFVESSQGTWGVDPFFTIDLDD